MCLSRESNCIKSHRDSPQRFFICFLMNGPNSEFFIKIEESLYFLINNNSNKLVFLLTIHGETICFLEILHPKKNKEVF